MADRRVAVLLLGAGQARRFGGDKLVADFRGRPLWRWAADACTEAGFDEYCLVVGEDANFADVPAQWTLVPNRHAASGMASSIRCGVASVRQSDRVVIALADMPLVAPEHLRALAAGDDPVFTRQADGSAGVPAAFPARYFDRLLALEGDRGAASLSFAVFDLLDPPDAEMLADVDTPADLSQLD